jgi:hypothetical protein
VTGYPDFLLLEELAEVRRQLAVAKTERQRDAQRYEAEITRLNEIVAASGRVDFDATASENNRVLLLRCAIGEEVLALARAPEEVFHAALTSAMSEFHAWMEARRRKSDATYRAVTAYAETNRRPTSTGDAP